MADHDKLTHLQRRAADLTRRSSPWTAQVLRLYPHLHVEDVQVIHAGRDLDRGRLADVATASGVADIDILYIARLYIRPDFHNLGDYYPSLMARYQRAGISDEWLNAFVSDPAHGGRLFLLHGTLHVWDDFSGELDDLLLEPTSEGDVIPDVVEGFLVSKGLAFDTSVDLLDASFQQQWTEWQSLWRLL
jgi:hypothetical protein